MKFYVLDQLVSDQTDADTTCISADTRRLGPAPRCTVCDKPVGMLPLLPPLQIEMFLGGTRFGDLVFGLGAANPVVSERFRDAFAQSGLTGLSGFIPAEVTEIITRLGRVPMPVPNYFMAETARSRAMIDDRACGIDYSRPWTCKECKIGGIDRLRRLVLEPGSWAGEDVFMARGLPGTIITSQRFKNFCEREAFSNCVLVDADHYHVDYFPKYGSGAARK